MKISKLRLSTLMFENNLNNTDLANLSGISRATLSSIRSGKSCSDTTACKIAKALNVGLDTIIEDKEEVTK